MRAPRKGMVERAPVMAEVEAKLLELETGLNDESVLVSLGIRAGVSPGTIYHLQKRPYPNMDFDIADRLFCALGIAHLWWTKLADVYNAVDLSGPSRTEPWEPVYDTLVCQDDECGREYTVLLNGNLNKKPKQRKYCSHSCSAKSNNEQRHVPKPAAHQRPKLYSRPVAA